MAFSQEEISTCRLDVGSHYVNVIYNQWGSANPMTGLGEGVSYARWLPNQEIEVGFRNGEIRHYTDHHHWYNIRGGYVGGL